MNIHCEGCVNEIKRGIEKIKGNQYIYIYIYVIYINTYKRNIDIKM